MVQASNLWYLALMTLICERAQCAQKNSGCAQEGITSSGKQNHKIGQAHFYFYSYITQPKSTLFIRENLERKMKQIAARRSKECGHRRRDPWLMDRLSYRRRQFAVRFFDEKLKNRLLLVDGRANGRQFFVINVITVYIDGIYIARRVTRRKSVKEI